MAEEIKKENLNGKPENTISGNGTSEQPKKAEAPPTDFKICEVWIRSGQIHLDAVDSFWQDRCRAIGVLELCKEIVKTAKAPQAQKPQIITGHGVMDWVRNGMRGKK